MTPRSSLLLALAVAPVAAIRYARRMAARALFAAGDGLMRVGWRVAPDGPPEVLQERPKIMLECEVCGTRRTLDDWGLGWDRGGAT